MATYSGGLLWKEKVAVPYTMLGCKWVVTSCGLSLSSSYVTAYQLVEMKDWHGPIYVYGATDTDWFNRVRVTQQRWYGFRVCVEDDPITEYVLGRKRVFKREPYPKAAPTGAQWEVME